MNIKLHHQALIDFRNSLYYGLIYPNNVNTADRVVKYREFYEVDDGKKIYYESDDGKQKLKIYSLECDIYSLPNHGLNELYALSKDQIDQLPIKVRPDGVRQMFLRKEDKACYIVDECSSFRIRPIKEMELKELISHFITPHSSPLDYELYAILGVSMILGRGAVWISTNPAFGKSGLLKTFNMLFDNVPVVERVRTVPAIYKHIPDDGILVVDEMAKKDAESSENLLYALNILGDVNEQKIVMNTGGSAAYGTNVPKSLRNTSVMCLMNRLSDYEDREKFAEYMFSNNAALDRRFLKLRPNDGNLDMGYFNSWEPYTDEEKDYLRKMARTIAYYKPHKVDNGWQSGYKLEANQKMVDSALKYGEGIYKPTHIATVRLVLEVLSIYCKDDIIKFGELSQLLFNWIKNYKDMLKDSLQDGEVVEAKVERTFSMHDTTSSVNPNNESQKSVVEVIRVNSINKKQGDNKSLLDIDEQIL